MDILRMLVATDGSEVGEHAVSVARWLASGDKAAVDVISVETEGLPGISRGLAVQRGASASATLWARGVPGIEIVRQACRSRADLVVLGRAARSPDEPTRLGPTSDAVIRRRQGPSLFIPPAISDIRRVVIALDGTNRGLGVLEEAAGVVAMTGAAPNSVIVIPGEDTADSGVTDPRVVRVREGLARFPSLGGASRLQVRRGTPVPEILRYLAEVKADLLVLGVRGGGPTGDMGSGHVGRDLLQSASVAILSIAI